MVLLCLMYSFNCSKNKILLEFSIILRVLKKSFSDIWFTGWNNSLAFNFCHFCVYVLLNVKYLENLRWFGLCSSSLSSLLGCCSPRGHKELDTTERLNWLTESKASIPTPFPFLILREWIPCVKTSHVFLQVVIPKNTDLAFDTKLNFNTIEITLTLRAAYRSCHTSWSVSHLLIYSWSLPANITTWQIIWWLCMSYLMKIFGWSKLILDFIFFRILLNSFFRGRKKRQSTPVFTSNPLQ